MPSVNHVLMWRVIRMKDARAVVRTDDFAW
jgi:hypothetical protein